EAVGALLERAQRLGLERRTTTSSGPHDAVHPTHPPESDPVWSNPTVAEVALGANAAEGAKGEGPKASPDSAGETKREVGSPAKDAGRPREAAERAEREGRSGPSTEELSVIETESAATRVGWSRRTKAIAASAGALAVAFSIWALGHRDRDAVPTPLAAMPAIVESSAPLPVAPASNAAIEPQVKPSNPLPEMIELRLTSRPTDVEVWLGDRKLGSSTSPLQVPRGSERVELRLKKIGFKDEPLLLTPDHDQALDATLTSTTTPLSGRRDPAPTGKPPVAPGKRDRLLEDRE
ncbi:MAG: hypothetical protein ABI193_03175, partial [Minicystis sp.]